MSSIMFNSKRRFYPSFSQRIPAPPRFQSLRIVQKLLRLSAPRLFRNLFAWRSRLLLFASLLFLLAAPSSFPQAWSGIIDPSRAVDWSNVGISQEIPTNQTQCGSTLPSTSTAADINTTIANCAPGATAQNPKFIQLGAGTFNLTDTIYWNGANYITLRGAAPGQTILRFSRVGANTCGGNGGNICVGPSTFYYNGNPVVLPGGTNAATWSDTTILKGANQITLTANAGLPTAGQVILLDQANDSSDTGSIYICDTNPACQQSGVGNPNGRVIGGVTHSQQQLVRITAVSGNILTISPGIYANNWRPAQSPGAWWTPHVTLNGVENMTVDYTDSTNALSGIYLADCDQCWVKNVESINANRNHVWLSSSSHDVVRDSYFYGTQHAASVSYGVETTETSDDLIENNIFQHIASPIMSGQGTGVVIGYNYALDDYYTPSPNWLTGAAASHNAGNGMNLLEGNQFNSIGCDDEWGSSDVITLFRNGLPGTGVNGSTQTSLQTQPITLMAYCRGYNVIGNVLGTPTYHTNYESFPPDSISSNLCDHTIYQLGWAGSECGTNGSAGVVNDTLVRNTLFRWGNYDTVTNGVRWCIDATSPCTGSEVPTSSSPPFINGNVVPANHNLPASFYVSAKPNWWGTMPWPATGPDVSGSNDPTGHSYANPAHLCFNSTPVDTSYHPSGTAYAVTSASWTNGTATLIVGTNSFSVGQLINVDGVVAMVNGNSTTSNGYNGAFRVTAQTGATVSYSVASNPGTYSSGGTAAYPTILAFSATNCYSTQGSPTFVQGALVQDSYNDPNINSTSLTFASPVTTGHLLWGFFAWDSATATNTVTDNCGNTWTNVGSPVTDTSAGFSAQIAYVANATGGSACTVTMTVSQSISPAIRYMTIHEVSGTSTSSPLDGYGGQINGTTSGGGCASADCLTSGNFTTTANGDYIAAGMADIYGNGATITAGTGYAFREGPDNVHGEELTTEDCVQSAASSSTVATFTPSAFSHGTVVVAAFKHQ